MEQALPFRLRAFDCVNGGEFLNHHLREYFCEPKNPVEYTRSRPYMKNDNAHIEQKNWTHVRQILGYMRFDRCKLVDMSNDLYTNELYLLNNFFIASFKLIDKYRDGARIIKKYDSPKTPYNRLIASGILPAYKQRILKKQLASLNPYLLHNQILIKIKRILNYAQGSNLSSCYTLLHCFQQKKNKRKTKINITILVTSIMTQHDRALCSNGLYICIDF